MNTKLLIGFVVVLVVLIVGLPLVSAMVKGDGGGEGASAPVEKAPPLLNTANLTGTAWEVKTPDIPIAVTIHLNPGGQAIATVPPMFSALAKQAIGTDTLSGTWKAEGAELTASVEFKGKSETVRCDIIGDKIYFKDKEIRRVQ